MRVEPVQVDLTTVYAIPQDSQEAVEQQQAIMKRLRQESAEFETKSAKRAARPARPGLNSEFESLAVNNEKNTSSASFSFNEPPVEKQLRN